jgi:hypothetical protein
MQGSVLTQSLSHGMQAGWAGLLFAELLEDLKAVGVFRLQHGASATCMLANAAFAIIPLQSEHPGHGGYLIIHSGDPGILSFTAQSHSRDLQTVIKALSTGASAEQLGPQPFFKKQLSTLAAKLDALKGSEQVLALDKQVFDDLYK